MRPLGLRGVTTTALAALVIPLASAGVADASTATVWPSAAALTLPSGATQASASLPSVSCGSTTQCIAVGSYSGASATQPMVATATRRVWGGGAAIVAPSGASASALQSVSCTGASTCFAVGGDTNSNTQHPILATMTTAGWSAAEEIAGAPAGSLSGVSCKSGGNCSAVGTNGTQPIAMNALAGSFTAVTPPTLPAGAQSGALTAVACTSPGNCAAVGRYVDASGQTQAMVASEVAGTWRAASPVALPSGAAGSGQNAELSAVSCPSNRHCVAVGSYVDAANQTAAMVDTQSSTATTGWARATALGLPTGTTASTLDSISCNGAGNCTTTGSYVSGSVAPLAATESGGTWSPATALPTPAGASAGGSLSDVALAVGCIAAEKCDAAGTYPDAAGVGAMGLVSHPSLAITSSTLPGGKVGKLYATTLATAGGVGGHTWSIAAGSLPAGLTLNGATGVIAGTPTTAQTATFTVVVSDAASPPDQATATLSITISPGTTATKPTTPTRSGTGTATTKKLGARIIDVKVHHGSRVQFKVKCVGKHRCRGRVQLVAVEHLRGKKVIAINASTHRARGTRTRTLRLGSVRYSVGAGRTAARTIRLGLFGRDLLIVHHRLRAGLAVRPAGARRATIQRRVTLHLPLRTAKKHHA